MEEANLSSRTLWFSVWDWDRFGKNEFLGEVRVPLTEAKLDGQSQLYGLSDNSNVVSSVPCNVLIVWAYMELIYLQPFQHIIQLLSSLIPIQFFLQLWLLPAKRLSKLIVDFFWVEYRLTSLL